MNASTLKQTNQTPVQTSSFQTMLTTRADIEHYLQQTGYWSDHDRRTRNEMVLTPMTYVISEKALSTLHQMGQRTYSAVQEVSNHLADSVRGRQTRRSQEYIGVMHRASKKLLTPETSHDQMIPPIIKLDLIAKDQEQFAITHIDAYNLRGLGYNLLLDGLVEQGVMISRDQRRGVCQTLGTSDRIAQILNTSAGSGNSIGVIIARNEQYYVPALEILAAAMRSKGFTLTFYSEDKINHYSKSALAELSDGNLLMIPNNLESPSLRTNLLELYKVGDVRLVMPPKAFLGSKLLTPQLRKCAGMESYIPESVYLSRHNDLANVSEGSWVLKRGQVRSGKALYFSNESDFHSQLRRQSAVKRASCILQREVKQEPTSHKLYTEQGAITYRKDYFRFVAYIYKDGLLGLSAISRPDRRVYGAKDCTLVPCVTQNI